MARGGETVMPSGSSHRRSGARPSGEIVVYVADADKQNPLLGKKRPLRLRTWSTVSDVKNVLQGRLRVPSHSQILVFGGKELRNAHSLQDCGVCRNNDTLYWALRPARGVAGTISLDLAAGGAGGGEPGGGPKATFSDLHTSRFCPPAAVPCLSAGLPRCPRDLERLFFQCKRGLLLGKPPRASMDGCGGTYFLSDPSGVFRTAFKPADEEPCTANSPTPLPTLVPASPPAGVQTFGRCCVEVAEEEFRMGEIVGSRGSSSGSSAPEEEDEELKDGAGAHHGQVLAHNHDHGHEGSAVPSLRRGIPPGQSCVREVLAYALDHRGRARVPPTTLAWCTHPKLRYAPGEPPRPKLGSLQAFTPNLGVAEDFSCSKFSVDEVHRLAVFDIRSLNCDRNAANVLVTEDLELVPIDHGFCFPEVLEIGWCDWCWLDWPAAKQPMSAETRCYILSLDPARDADMVRHRFGLPVACARLVRVAGVLLQEACRAGLTLFQVANLVARQDIDNQTPSLLEEALAQGIHEAEAAPKVHWRSSVVAGAERGAAHSCGGSTTATSTAASSPDSVAACSPSLAALAFHEEHDLSVSSTRGGFGSRGAPALPVPNPSLANPEPLHDESDKDYFWACVTHHIRALVRRTAAAADGANEPAPGLDLHVLV